MCSYKPASENRRRLRRGGQAPVSLLNSPDEEQPHSQAVRGPREEPEMQIGSHGLGAPQGLCRVLVPRRTAGHCQQAAHALPAQFPLLQAGHGGHGPSTACMEIQ